MTWQIRLAAAGAPLGAGEVLDLVGLRSLVPLVASADVVRAGRVVGQVREPVLLSRELFALAEITDPAFDAQLEAWERCGRLATAVALWIHGRRVVMDQLDGEPSCGVYTAVASVDVVDLPRGTGCILWSDQAAATGGGEVPSRSAPAPRAWRPRARRGEDPLGALRRRFERGRPGVR